MATEPSDPDADAPVLPAPLEQAVELLVYAPLGFALDLRRQFPEYVARGRREVVQLHAWLGRRAQAAARESSAALRGLGRTSSASEPDDADTIQHHETPTLSVVPDAPASSPTAGMGAVAPPIDEPDLDAEVLAIPGYESLSASQVVPRLVSLTADELEAIRCYEEAVRGRKTILSRIAQLQAG